MDRLVGGDSQHRGTVAGLATNGTGLRAVGSVWPRNGGQDTATAAIWESADDKNWHLRIIDEAARTQADAIASGDIGSVIVGGNRDEQTGTIWFIPSGSSQPKADEFDAFVHQVVELPGRFVAVQDCRRRSDCQSQTILIGRPAGTAASPGESSSMDISGWVDLERRLDRLIV